MNGNVTESIQEASREMLVGEDDTKRVEDELARCQIQAETIAMQRYSDVDKARFAKVIKDFNALYHKMHVQTWCNTKWRGVPLCKAPTDLWVYQELIHIIQPQLIIETGSLAGGSALFMRDIMQLDGNDGYVISIDIESKNIMDAAKRPYIKFFQASSTSLEAVQFVKDHIASFGVERVMVILDSDHTYEHVLRELQLYAPLVSIGSALIVEDTNNHPGPLEAAHEWYINQSSDYEFKRDYMCEKFMLTFNRDGYFERTR